MKKVMSIILSLAMLVAFAAFSPPAHAEGPAAPAAMTATWHIIGSNVNFRRTASSSGEIIGLVQYGDTFDNLGLYSGDGTYWRKCKMTSGSWSGYTGYVANQYVDYS